VPTASPTNYVLSVKCVPDPDNGDFKWIDNRDEKDDDDLTIYEDVLTDNGKLKEPPCTTAALELTKEQYEEEGLVISCLKSDPTEDFKINAPNTCILLCDFYEIFTFFPGFKTTDPTKRGWLYSVDGVTSVDLVSDNICCFNC